MSYTDPKPPSSVLFSVYIWQGRELEKHWTNGFFFSSSSLFLFPIFCVVFNWLVGVFFVCWCGLIFILIFFIRERIRESYLIPIFSNNHSTALFCIPIWTAWKHEQRPTTFLALEHLTYQNVSWDKQVITMTFKTESVDIWKQYLLIDWKS